MFQYWLKDSHSRTSSKQHGFGWKHLQENNRSPYCCNIKAEGCVCAAGSARHSRYNDGMLSGSFKKCPPVAKQLGDI